VAVSAGSLKLRLRVNFTVNNISCRTIAVIVKLEWKKKRGSKHLE
jgi:hypothetical protein